MDINKIEAAQRELDEIKESSGYNEVMRQRKTLPAYGVTGRKMQNRSIELSDLDKKFLDYVRGKGSPSEMKALVEDSTGRYLISPAVENEFLRTIADLVVVRGLASVKPTGKDRIEVRNLGEATVAYGKLETGSAIPESDLTPTTPTTVYIEDINGLSKIGVDELEDSDESLVTFLGESFGRAVSNLENTKFLKGAGHGSLEPEGICTNATLLANALETADDGVVIVEDFMQLIYAVPAQYRKGSSFIVNSLTELELRKLRSGGSTPTDGPFLWQPAVAQGAPNTFLGYPIYTCDAMDDLSDVEGVLAVFGNLMLGYRIYDRKGVTVERMNELYREAGLIGFILHTRNTGMVIRPADKRLVLLKEHSA
jgi:HK97 family phage major capsid protein